jgi:adenosylcobalamin-dependent ribonucleoside-triphosphate reductase
VTTVPSFRAQLVTRRTYNRPTNDEGTTFETWAETVFRVIQHQQWLWERAQGHELNARQRDELTELMQLMEKREALTSGRTLWLGGTDVAKIREASQFNCSFARVETVYDIVDSFWLLLQGCGVGFEPVRGVLSGFAKPVTVEVIRSTRTDNGVEHNAARHYERNGQRVIHLIIGDSAMSWAKAVGKIAAFKRPFDVLILDFSQIRPGGKRLKGYGWIASGDETISTAFTNIAEIFNRRSGQLLSRIDILDVVNWLGTTLSSRRAAEICTIPFGDPEAMDFARAKKDYWSTGNMQRAQSNNSLVFYEKPSLVGLTGIFDMMQEAGGSEPGFINGEHALRRAPWFRGVNPCAEILLGNKSFCNLVETDIGKFRGRFADLKKAIWLIGRANYRQTCVNLKDGVLSDSWHELNEFLRLCGVGLTGIVRSGLPPQAFRTLRSVAQTAVDSMADELGLPRAKAVTTIKPSGTLSKIMDTTEGAHKPLGRFIINNVNFSIYDPVLPKLEAAGYRLRINPSDPTGMLVSLPVSYDDVPFDTVEKNGVEMQVNTESAVSQLERYRMLMRNYVDHNCSITVSYSPEEAPEIVSWLHNNWDDYVGVSFLYRTDPTKTAEDLGYQYLPQEVVTEDAFRAYTATLQPVDLDSDTGSDLVDDACATGACPVR